nr:hypothetical protein [Tanacetum cinerariifolium]
MLSICSHSLCLKRYSDQMLSICSHSLCLKRYSDRRLESNHVILHNSNASTDEMGNEHLRNKDFARWKMKEMQVYKEQKKLAEGTLGRICST